MISAAEFTLKTRKKSKILGQRKYILRKDQSIGTAHARPPGAENEKIDDSTPLANSP